ncbi:MAG TPA: bifunctional adenosylcobinamide kinase/adenosylcobinamide-phosphate guanylyltransferase [Acidimicrobiia bacterium]|nr:bifunctional adenosylcobinamide kinase/adenosylcobinamide-phosphate guanylyltransferase [Acidimicrobiia bacterium]
MPYVMLTGGARSGKSAAAERRALAAHVPVTVIATAEAGDDEMAARIARHRSTRPPAWHTVEEPVDLCGAVHGVDTTRFVLIDCLTLWLANVIERSDEAVVAEAATLADLLADRPGDGVVVTNEVGDGIVPADPDTRRYRDLLGRVNGQLAARADEAFLVVAGRFVPLQEPSW